MWNTIDLSSCSQEYGRNVVDGATLHPKLEGICVEPEAADAFTALMDKAASVKTCFLDRCWAKYSAESARDYIAKFMFLEAPLPFNGHSSLIRPYHVEGVEEMIKARSDNELYSTPEIHAAYIGAYGLFLNMLKAVSRN